MPGISSALTSSKHHFRPVVNISSQTKKRKAAEAISASDKSTTRSSKRIASAAPNQAGSEKIETPPSPLTNGMDSDDDFMSGGSSDLDVLMDESENENESEDGM